MHGKTTIKNIHITVGNALGTCTSCCYALRQHVRKIRRYWNSPNFMVSQFRTFRDFDLGAFTYSDDTCVTSALELWHISAGLIVCYHCIVAETFTEMHKTRQYCVILFFRTQVMVLL
jgi:hypothetical protein